MGMLRECKGGLQWKEDVVEGLEAEVEILKGGVEELLKDEYGKLLMPN